MSELDILQKLVSTARREEIPEVDVTARVLATLSAPEDDVNRPLAWIAGLSFAGALPVTAMAFSALEALRDPLEEIFSTFGGLIL